MEFLSSALNPQQLPTDLQKIVLAYLEPHHWYWELTERTKTSSDKTLLTDLPIEKFLCYLEIFLLDNQKEVVTYLIQNYPAVLSQLLTRAAAEGQLVMVKYLTSIGNPKITESLRRAAGGNHLEIVKHLLPLGPQEINWGLRGAVEGGHLEMVKYLLSQGATNIGMARAEAAAQSNLALYDYLFPLETFDLNYALWWAAHEGQYEIVTYLVSKGATDLEKALAAMIAGSSKAQCPIEGLPGARFTRKTNYPAIRECLESLLRIR